MEQHDYKRVNINIFLSKSDCELSKIDDQFSNDPAQQMARSWLGKLF